MAWVAKSKKTLEKGIKQTEEASSHITIWNEQLSYIRALISQISYWVRDNKNSVEEKEYKSWKCSRRVKIKVPRDQCFRDR
jgi:hypothetical protein